MLHETEKKIRAISAFLYKLGSSLFRVGRFEITIIDTGIFRLIRVFKYLINIHELSTKS
jgi:hypothetical protein